MDDETAELNSTDDYEFVMVHGILDEGSSAHVMDKLEAPGYKVGRKQPTDENRC